MDVNPSDSGNVRINNELQTSFPSVLSFNNGESVELVAVPKDGYKFDGWRGDASGSHNTTTITMDRSKKITASFSIIEHVLTMKFTGNGYVTPEVGTHMFRHGSVVVIGAVSVSGWAFDSWAGSVSDPNLPITKVVINSDTTLTAKFT